MLNRANEFNDSLDTIKAVGMVAFQQLGTQLAAYLAPVMEKVVDLVGRLANWFSELSPRTQAIIAAIAGVVAIAAPLLMGLGQVAFAISSIISLIAVVGPAIAGIVAALGPVLLIIAAVVAAGVLLYRNWDTIKAKAQELWATITEKFTAIKTDITTKIDAVKSFLSNTWDKIKTAASAAWEAIKNAMTSPIQNAWNTIQGIINTIKNMFPINLGNIFNFKLPHIEIGSKTVKVGDKDVTVPTFNVNWYAQGGIFDGASLIGVGEAGPEAVVPLDRFWEEIGNINARTDTLIQIQNVMIAEILDELHKEKDFKVNGIWAGRYVNKLARHGV